MSFQENKKEVVLDYNFLYSSNKPKVTIPTSVPTSAVLVDPIPKTMMPSIWF